jgi:membrane-bound metal-dependent hydrolase YbcI (DUF457 family)
MAGFKTHLTVSTLTGIGYGTAAYYVFHLPAPACVLAGGLCSVSGMLPDIDSDSGRPLRESIAFAAAVVPVMLVDRLQTMQLSHEWIVLICAGVYLLIRFGMAAFLKRYTVHRGMFHSIPAAAIFGEIAFLLASGDTNIRIFKAAAVSLGYVSHLLLDEIWSVQFRVTGLRFKSSFGTAMKFFSRSGWANCSTYLKLALFTFLALKEPGWSQKFYDEHLRAPVEQTAERIEEEVGDQFQR